MQRGQPGRDPDHTEPVHSETDAHVQSYQDRGCIVPVLRGTAVCGYITQPPGEHTQ